jgi:phosphatidylglycerophosphate synthase
MATAKELPVQLRGPQRVLTQSANLVSVSRFVLASIWVAIFFGGHAHTYILGVIALCGAASDFLDGRIARRTNSANDFGRWLDNVADIAFILAALSCEAYAGVIPAYLPALIAASFVQYAVDSVVMRGSPVPVKSRLGHWGGIFNYGLVILLAWVPARRFPAKFAGAFPPIIGSFYVAAMCERALFYRTRRLLARTPVSGQQPVSRCG